MAAFKSGFTSILGRPNVGKSTLFNTLLGDKMAIVSEKPQTTRNRILGIKNIEEAQLIILDTPGIHEAHSALNQRMVSTAIAAAMDADILLFLVDAPSPSLLKDQAMINATQKSRGVPVLAINKIDLVKKPKLLPLIDQYQHLHSFREIIPISATTGEGVDVLVDVILNHLPESPPLYPADMITDQTERFLVSEIIREKVIQQSHQEIPYSTAVSIETFEDRQGKNLAFIRGTIYVERHSQKKILVGKGGQKLKRIGEPARKEVEALLGKRVFLELRVAVIENWTRNSQALARLSIS